MLIKEVCDQCHLTKKAIEYYEKQGLIKPEIGENGYRHYDEQDIASLKEIAVLRKLGISIPDIQTILNSNHKSAALSKCKYRMELEQQREKSRLERMEHLIHHYDIDREFTYLQSNLKEYFTIKDKLVQAFPGSYGIYVSIHFGQFLNDRIDSVEQEKAYDTIVSFLDQVEIPANLQAYVEKSFSMMQQENMEKTSTSLVHAVSDLENYMNENKETFETYLAFRTSSAYKESEAYRMQQLLIEFQKSSGYTDVFLPNFKILSPSYLAYTRKLEEANAILIEKYPQLKDLYS